MVSLLERVRRRRQIMPVAVEPSVSGAALTAAVAMAMRSGAPRRRTSKAATARARSAARTAPLPVAGSTSAALPSTSPVMLQRVRGSRSASRAQATSAAASRASAAEPGAKRRPGGGSDRHGRRGARCAEALARSRAASALLVDLVAWSSTKKPTSSSARSASVISQSGARGRDLGRRRRSCRELMRRPRGGSRSASATSGATSRARSLRFGAGRRSRRAAIGRGDQVGEQRAVERGEQGDRHRAADRARGRVIVANMRTRPISVPTMPIAGAVSAAPAQTSAAARWRSSARGGAWSSSAATRSASAPSTIAATAAATSAIGDHRAVERHHAVAPGDAASARRSGSSSGVGVEAAARPAYAAPRRRGPGRASGVRSTAASTVPPPTMASASGSRNGASVIGRGHRAQALQEAGQS